MHDLSETVNRKFIESFDISEWEVETDTGWHDILSSNKTIPYEVWRLETEFGSVLECADDHIVFGPLGQQIFVKDLKPGMKIITRVGLSDVKSVEPLGFEENMYDLSVDSENHRYWTGDILSHNTTTACVVILHYILFNEHKTVGLLAHKADGAREILSRIKQSFEALPTWLQQGVVIWNKGDIELENGCKVIAAATTSSSIRGKSCAFIYIDECAFVENWDDFYSSTYPTISSGETTKLLFTSTPNGLNHFYRFCDGAKKNINGFKYVEVPWYEIPGRGEAWKKETLEAMNNDLDRFAVEFECQFSGSSNTLISGSALKQLFSIDPIVSVNDMKQYEAAKANHRYVMIVDVSRGKGLDYSAFQVIDVTTMPYRQVCVYRNNMITPVDYASIVNYTSKMYNDALLLIEINDVGAQVADTLYMDYENENVISTEHGGAAGRRISSGFGPNVDRGLRTTKTVKRIGCSTLKLLIEQQQLIVQDENTISELATFSKKADSYEAEQGKHDDLVMCLVLFAWLSTQPYFKEMTDINTLMHLRDRTEQEIADEMITFFLSDGQDLNSEEVIDINPGNYSEFSGFF